MSPSASLLLPALLLVLPTLATAQSTVTRSGQRYADVYAQKIELQGSLREKLQEALDRVARPYDVFVMVQIDMVGVVHQIVDKQTKEGMDIKLGASEKVKLPGLPAVRGPQGAAGNPNVTLKLPGETKVQVRDQIEGVVEKLTVRIFVERGMPDEQLERVKQAAVEVSGIDEPRGDVLDVQEAEPRLVQTGAISGAAVAQQSVYVFSATLLLCAIIVGFALTRRRAAEAGESSRMTATFQGGEGEAATGSGNGVAALGGDDAVLPTAELSDAAARRVRFTFLRGAPMDDLVEVLQRVKPQTAAAILQQVPVPAKTGELLLQGLEGDQALKLLEHMARAAVVPIGEIELMEQESEAALDKVQSQIKLGDAGRAADLLSLASQDNARRLLEQLGKKDADLVELIRRGMVLFEDIPTFSEIEVRELVSSLDPGITVVALQGAPAELKSALMKPISKRLRGILESEAELTVEQDAAKVEAARKQVERAMRRVRRAHAGEAQQAAGV